MEIAILLSFTIEIYEGDIVLREITVFGTSVNEDFIGEVKCYECRWWIDNGNDAMPLWNEADIFLIGLIVGIYMREVINLFKRDKPPDDIELIIDWVERGE